MIRFFISKDPSKVKNHVALLSLLFITSSAICMDSFETSSVLIATPSNSIVTPPSPTKKSPIKIKQNTISALTALTPPISNNTYLTNNKYASLFLTDESNACLDKIKIKGIESLLSEKSELDADKDKKFSEIRQSIIDHPLQVCNFTKFPYHKMDHHVTVNELEILNKEHSDFLSDFNEGIKDGAYFIKTGEIKILTSFIGMLVDIEINSSFSNINKYRNALNFFKKNNKSKGDTPLNLHISLFRYCCNMHEINAPKNDDKTNMEKYLKNDINSKHNIGIMINNFTKTNCFKEYSNYIKIIFDENFSKDITVENACTTLDKLNILDKKSDILFLNGEKYIDSDHYKFLNAYLKNNNSINFKNLFQKLKKKNNFIFINNFNQLKSDLGTLATPFETVYEHQLAIQNFIKKTPDFENHLMSTQFKTIMETPSKPKACVLKHSILPNSDYVYDLVEHLNKSKNKLSDLKIEPTQINTSLSSS